MTRTERLRPLRHVSAPRPHQRRSADPDAEGFEQVYFVLGIRRSFGLVRNLCLGGAERPFLLARSYF